MVAAGEGAFSRLNRKIVVSCAGDGKKFLPLRRLGYTIPQDQGQIGCRCGVNLLLSLTILLPAVQSVGGDKPGIPAANLVGLFVHPYRKLLHRTCNPLSNHHRGIVVGFQHQGVKKILQKIRLPRFHSHAHLRLGSIFFGSLKPRICVSCLQSQNTGHNLGCAGHGPAEALILAIKNPPIGAVHKNRGLGIKLQFCRNALCLGYRNHRGGRFF